MFRSLLWFCAMALLCAFFCAACSETDKASPEKTGETKKTGEEPAKTPEEGEGGAAEEKPDGKTLVEERCVRCHGLEKIESHEKMDKDHWTKTVDTMIEKGAWLEDAEREAVIDYLSNR